MKLGSHLKQLRARKKLTLREVAELLDIPVSTYRDWEYGKAIQGEPYVKLAKIFGVSLSELLMDAPAASRDDLLRALEEARARLDLAIQIARAL